MSAESNRLRVHQFSVYRGFMPLFTPLSQGISAGQILCLHGANGIGKTSLLRAIAGLYSHFSGEVLWNDTPIKEHPDYPNQLVYIGHQKALRPALSVQDHVRFWANAYGRHELLDAALRYFDLTPLAHMRVHQLSAGWQQRLSLARLILHPASLWLLDEPLNNLDAEGAHLLQSLLQARLAQSGMAVVASHQPWQGDRVHAITLQPAQGVLDA